MQNANSQDTDQINNPNQMNKITRNRRSRVCMCGWLELYLVTHKQIVNKEIYFFLLVLSLGRFSTIKDFYKKKNI